jgi:hypothetical protein
LATSLLLVFAAAGFAQHISVGVKGGFPLTDSLITNPGGYTFNSARKYIIGGMVELGLPLGLSVEGDVLFHPFNIKSLTNPPPGFFASTLYDFRVIDFPVVAKYRITGGLARPYIEGGLTFRGRPSTLAVPRVGLTLGGGLEFKLPVVRISPEVRYTRWGQDNLIVAAGNHIQAEQQNQAAVLLGISF